MKNTKRTVRARKAINIISDDEDDDNEMVQTRNTSVAKLNQGKIVCLIIFWDKK